MPIVNIPGGNYVCYGGIKFNKDEVASVKKTKAGQFEVKLKTGQNLIYKDQTASIRSARKDNPDFNPQVKATIADGIAYLNAQDLYGVEVIGNPNRKDSIGIDGGSNIVRTDNDNHADKVLTYNRFQPVSKGLDLNTVVLGKNDEWTDKNLFKRSKDNAGKMSIFDPLGRKQ